MNDVIWIDAVDGTQLKVVFVVAAITVTKDKTQLLKNDHISSTQCILRLDWDYRSATLCWSQIK